MLAGTALIAVGIYLGYLTIDKLFISGPKLFQEGQDINANWFAQIKNKSKPLPGLLEAAEEAKIREYLTGVGKLFKESAQIKDIKTKLFDSYLGFPGDGNINQISGNGDAYGIIIASILTPFGAVIICDALNEMLKDTRIAKWYNSYQEKTSNTV